MEYAMNELAKSSPSIVYCKILLYLNDNKAYKKEPPLFLVHIDYTFLSIKLIKSLAWYRCSTLMVPCATLSRYRSYHSLGTGTTEVI